jgi:hypothetical protein
VRVLPSVIVVLGWVRLVLLVRAMTGVIHAAPPTISDTPHQYARSEARSESAIHCQP